MQALQPIQLPTKESQIIHAGFTSKIPLSNVFNDRYGSYLNKFNLFIAHFNAIPHCIQENEIDCKRANKWFVKQFEAEIKNCYYNKRYLHNSTHPELDDSFYFLYEDLIVNFDTTQSEVRFLFCNTAIEKVQKLIDAIHKIKNNQLESKSEISLIIEGHRGLDIKAMKVTKPKLSIEDNYNSDFMEIHKIIYKRLASKNDKGLVLLHGQPGTGKTSYIRYLVSSVKKQIIFLPPTFATALTNPSLISILINNPNSILVIEDAENVLIDRQRSGDSPVSSLLNITDGLLADCLNVQIICSFNTEIANIDKALMRKGRLIAKYEFGALEIEKAQLLSDKLGFNTLINEPMTLTSIYNQNEVDFEQTKKRNVIGFGGVR